MLGKGLGLNQTGRQSVPNFLTEVPVLNRRTQLHPSTPKMLLGLHLSKGT